MTIEVGSFKKEASLPRVESLVGTEIFSPEAREALEKKGYAIYQLTGQSIKNLEESGRKFWLAWHKNYPRFETLPSRLTEVAININPEKLFLPFSNMETPQKQEKTIFIFNKNLSERILGVEAVLGEAPDYVELAFIHLDKTGEYLFGGKYHYNYTSTKTPVSGYDIATVGAFSAEQGLGLSLCSYYHRNFGLTWAAPLIVPREVNQEDMKVWQNNIAKKELVKEINAEKKKKSSEEKKKDPIYKIEKEAMSEFTKWINAEREEKLLKRLKKAQFYELKKKEKILKRKENDPYYGLWQYANEHNLLDKMVEKRCLTNKEIETLRNLFEDKKIKNYEKKFSKLIDKFGIAVANLA